MNLALLQVTHDWLTREQVIFTLDYRSNPEKERVHCCALPEPNTIQFSYTCTTKALPMAGGDLTLQN
jgi:hypothetical protein